MLPRYRRWLKVIAGIFAGSVLMIGAAFFFAQDLLCIERQPVPSAQVDAIIVLGGRPDERGPRAAELFAQIRPSRVFVVGQGDCQESKRQLINHGVPPDSIDMECESRSTKENAAFSVPRLREAHARRVVIVTSWFHSRRAINTFRKAAPEIEFYSVPSWLGMSRWPDLTKDQYIHVLKEYAKTAVYWVYYGIRPF